MMMENQYIYAVSNSIPIGDENMLSKFSHLLAKPLHLPKRENWGLCLHSFSCHNQLDPDCDAHLVKVLCEQVASDTNTKKIISVHSRKAFNIGLNKRHFFSPKSKDYFPICHDTLDRLSFEILDENNNRLGLSSGTPTWIVLHLKRMSGAFLPLRVSSDPTENYPSNTASDFSFDLPAELGYSGQSQFEVCLSSITYTPNFDQLPFFDDDSSAKIFVQLSDAKLELKDEIFASAKFDAKKDYLCEEELIFKVMKYFEFFKDKDKIFKDLYISLTYDTDSGHASFHAKNMQSHHKLKVYLPTPLARQLGFRKTRISGQHSEIPLHAGVESFGDFPVDINHNFPSSMVLYSNFSRPALFGIGMSSILKIIPVNISEAHSAKYVTYESEDLEWYGISYSSVSGLQFRLLGLDGKPIQFLPGASVHICLKLRLRDSRKNLIK